MIFLGEIKKDKTGGMQKFVMPNHFILSHALFFGGAKACIKLHLFYDPSCFLKAFSLYPKGINAIGQVGNIQPENI